MDFAKWRHVRVFGIHLCKCNKTLSRLHTVHELSVFFKIIGYSQAAELLYHRRTKPEHTT